MKLFDDGVLYGVAADGRVFSGDDLRTAEPSLDGARSIAGAPEGWVILGSAPDGFQCAALRNGDVDCVGSDVNGDIDPIPTSSCGNPNNACAQDNPDCLRLFGPTSYLCVKDWTPVPNLRELVQLHRTCGIDSSGQLVCWGQARAGAQPPRPISRLAGELAILDDGTLFDRNASALVAGLANVIDAAGATGTKTSTACAVESDSSLWCWGSNLFALVGDGTTTDRISPVKVGDGFASVRIGGGLAIGIACGVMKDGGVSCWGLEPFAADAGTPGTACGGTETCVATPTRVAGIAGAAQVVPMEAGEALVLTNDGRVVHVSNLYAAPAQTVVHPIGP